MNPQQIIVPNDLALRLSHWHSSMYDPIYAVGSCGLARHPVTLDTFEGALDRIEDCLADKEHFLDSKAELEEISFQMRAIIGKIQEGQELRKCIARSMARTYWALVWADEAERRDDVELFMGCNFYEIAPQTPQRAFDAALEDLGTLEKDHGKPLQELFAPYEKMGPYDFGHELAMSISGYGGDIDLKTHYTELDYYNFADEWIAEDEA